ncbi:MAG: hypothetical protein ACE5PM_08820 [Candidatus Hydrothermarchaeales archaeon]
MISKLEKHILFKLYRNLYIGGRHTSEDNVVKGLPKHVRGEAKKALKSLIKKGYILPKPTSYGLQVSLNPRMIGEIKQILED